MGWWGGFFKFLLLDFFPSIGDLGTDILNAFDMFGYNITTTIYSSITDTTNSTLIYREDPVWGAVSLSLVFFPGVILAITMIADDWRHAGNWCAAVIMGICYPATMCFMQIAGFRGGHADMILLAVAYEAFFESAPQLLLQIFTILNGYPTSTLQIVTISFSFLLLAKTSILVDLLAHDIRTFDYFNSKYLLYLLAVTPVYVTSIIFRVGSLAIITSYLRYYAIIPIIAMALTYAALAIKYGYYKDEFPIAIVANVGSFTRGLGGSRVDVEKSFLFLVYSTICTLGLHSVTLTSILVMAQFHPGYIPHWNKDQLILFDNTPSIIVGLIILGVVNLGLLYVTMGKLQNPNLQEKKKEEAGLEME